MLFQHCEIFGYVSVLGNEWVCHTCEILMHYVFFFFSPTRAMASSFTRFLDHTQRRATVGRTPLERAISSSQRPLPDNTHQTNINAPGGIRTHDRSRRAAIHLRLRPRGHWERHWCSIYSCKMLFEVNKLHRQHVCIYNYKHGDFAKRLS
jgi:hypothetical protein